MNGNSGNWTTGVITDNDDNFITKGFSNLGFTNTGTATVFVNGYPLLPNTAITVTESTVLENERVRINFSGTGTRQVYYSTVIQSLCACKN